MPTVPTSLTDPDVLAFIAHYKLTPPPVFVPYQNHGYSPNWCHASAKAHAMKNGGRRVHGWSFWDFPHGLMAEFHSVWEDETGALIDVTPPKYGATAVMFVPDDVTDIYLLNNTMVQPADRMTPPANPPFWYAGNVINQPIWGFPENDPPFVAYLTQVGMTAADYPT